MAPFLWAHDQSSSVVNRRHNGPKIADQFWALLIGLYSSKDIYLEGDFSKRSNIVTINMANSVCLQDGGTIVERF